MKFSLLQFGLAGILLIGASLPIIAADYEIEVTATKKTIHIDKLHLPGDTPVISYLMTLPELSDKDRDTFLSRYDIQLDGQTVTDSRDALLASLFLRDLREITISSSPSKSHIRNGPSGTIDLKPVAIPKGFGGNATLLGTVTTGVMPSMSLRYSDGSQFEARADLNLDFYYPTSVSSIKKEAPQYTIFGADTLRNRDLGQMARLYAKWKPTKNDELKIWFWQNYSIADITTSSFRTLIEDKSSELGPGWQYSITETSTVPSRSDDFSCVALIDYTHFIKTGELNANADYHYNYGNGSKSDVLNIELMNLTKFNFSGKGLNLETRLNASSESERNFQNSTFYFSPMIKLTYDSKHIKAAINGRYKAYSRNYTHPDMAPHSSWYHDWTGDFGVLWQIVDHHALRLRMTRNIDIPSNNLIYPEIVFDPDSQLWRKGNPTLKGPATSSANLEYITDWTKDKHRIIFDISAEYNHKDREINFIFAHDVDTDIIYTYPVNTSKSDIISLTSMLSYSYGPFSMTIGGNYFYNMDIALTSIKNLKASYFNFQFCPTVQLKKNWLLNASFLYNSKMRKERAIIGSSTVLNLRVSKTIGDWTLFASIQDVFDGTSTDQETLSNEIVFTTYDPFLRTLGIGANYKF